ncbi:hypothetical protein AB0B31_07665 [Catellatospora citrea]|uniref:hypothetical protein n=1 Tax=Catellatospora citrea TaxID=53366 RepID=UPI0033E6197D
MSQDVAKVPRMPRKSFYDLNFRVSPGGARKDAHYIRGDLAEIKADLAAELTEGVNLYLLCWYGAELTLDVHQHGARLESIDLHPYLTISVEGHPDVTFTGPGEPVGWDFEEDEETDEGSLSDQLFVGDLEDRTTVTVHWDRIDVPPLRGDVVGPGDLVTLDGRRPHEEDAIPYGFTDLES